MLKFVEFLPLSISDTEDDMDISPAAMANATAQMKQAQTIQQGQIAVFKKTMDIAETSIAQLIQSVPQPPSLATSGNLGTKLNVYA
jgi:ABC-type microcin C transport system permease subunit YejE